MAIILAKHWQPLVKMTLENRIKMTVQGVIGIWQLPNPWQTKRTAVSIVLVRRRRSKASLEHIMLEHERELSQRRIERDEVVELVKGATMVGTRIGFQGKGTGRPIVALKYHGELMVIWQIHYS